MKRLQSRSNLSRGLRCCLVALTALIGGLVAASKASAAVTDAPEITAQPTNPNTTEGTVRFEYEVGEDETSGAVPLRFYCRRFPTATPPAATAGWASCGLSTSPDSLFREFTSLSNESHTFEVAVRETTSIATQGPIASYVWVQDLPAPSQAPELIETPEDPNTTSEINRFVFRGGSGEAELPDRFECSRNGEPFSACGGNTISHGSGVVDFSAYGGEQSFRVRAGTVAGYGPAAEYNWSIDLPDPEPSVEVEDVAAAQWSGQSEGAQAGGASSYSNSHVNVGDINGDGRQDLAIRSRSLADNEGYVDVIFGSPNMSGSERLGTQSASEGFRIMSPSSFGTGGSIEVQPIGDQNGDGIDEMIVGYYTDMFPPPSYGVIYGGVDPSDLPDCLDVEAKCLDVGSMPADAGYVLAGSFDQGNNISNGSTISGGDFDGDGIDDIMLASGINSGHAYVVKGADRTGTHSVASLPTDELLTIQAFPTAGDVVTGLGDLDGDGKDDMFVGGAFGGQATVIYGRDIGGEFDSTSLASEDGFYIYHTVLISLYPTPVGDVNGDGQPEIAITRNGEATGATPFDFSTVQVLTVPERGTGGSMVVADDELPADGLGYVIDRGNLVTGWLGSRIGPEVVGDANNDGTPDMLMGTPLAPVAETPQRGIGYLVFGQVPFPTERVSLGSGLTPDVGVAILGSNETGRFGAGYAPLGDLDGDGLPDFSMAAPQASPGGDIEAGTVYIIYGKALINQVKTQSAVAIDNGSAVVNAGVSTNNRDTDVRFEYGTTDEYGETTSVQEFEASNSGDAASVAIGGLEKNTTYHYRAVATNELGLTRYGDDRTFTTTNTADPTPPSNCDTDSTLPGCKDYDHCKAVPEDCQGGENSKAKLTLISSPKTIKVKRGKKGSLAAIVVNSGGQNANGVKVCVNAPKKFVKVKRCLKVGKLGSGATRTKTFKVKVKKMAKKGKKLKLKFTATSNDAGKKTGKATVKVK
jgi:hypothetical protein